MSCQLQNSKPSLLSTAQGPKPGGRTLHEEMGEPKGSHGFFGKLFTCWTCGHKSEQAADNDQVSGQLHLNPSQNNWRLSENVLGGYKYNLLNNINVHCCL